MAWPQGDVAAAGDEEEKPTGATGKECTRGTLAGGQRERPDRARAAWGTGSPSAPHRSTAVRPMVLACTRRPLEDALARVAIRRRGGVRSSGGRRGQGPR